MDKKIIRKRNNCRGCFSKKIFKFLDLGNMPLAGGFLKKKDIINDKKFPLKIYFCKDCGLVQILNVINPKTLFEEYFYVSSVIKSLSLHFKKYAEFLKKNYLNSKGSQLLEFGSNDGVLLQHFTYSKKIQAFGIDPSKNVSKIAQNKGLNITVNYFTQKSAKKLLKKYGKMDVVSGSNVFAHADNIHEIIKAGKILLKKNGVFIIEVHYLHDLLKDFQYDTLYHEHLSYYSISSLNIIFKLEGLKIINVQHLTMHGGGIRVVCAFENSDIKVKPSVLRFIKNEKSHKLNKLETYLNFEKKCKKHKEKLVKLLKKIKRSGKSIVGYGAPGRGTTLLNYCNIGNDILEYIVDASPLRAGKCMPGVYVPIYNLEKSRENPPDYFLVLAWNYIDSILKQEKNLRKKGIKFIIPFPKIKII